MPTPANSSSSPEVLFIGPLNADDSIQPLERAGFKVVSKQPSEKALEKSVLEHFWRAILVDSGTPEAFLEAFAKERPVSPVLLLSREWPCKLPRAEDWTCIRLPRESERLVRDFVDFLSQHPIPATSSFPSWVSQVLPATRAKNRFSKLLQDVEKGSRVVVTKHDSPSAVVVSYKEFEALHAQNERALNGMRARFDTLVAEMQKPDFERGVDALFSSTPDDLGQAAVEAARSRD